MTRNDPLRKQMAKYLDWKDAHASFDDAVADMPPALRGVRPPGVPHSVWELVEHIRRTQEDILTFCQPGAYTEMSWPADYWPSDPAPSSAKAWSASIAAVRADRATLQRIAEDSDVDLLAVVPHGEGAQTYLREMLMVVDHAAYHVGQIVTTRRALGAWPDSAAP